MARLLGGGDNGQVFRIVSQRIVENDIGFLERFLTNGGNADSFANDQITGKQFTWFGKNKVPEYQRVLAWNIGDLGAVVREFVKTFLAGSRANRERGGFFTV